MDVNRQFIYQIAHTEYVESINQKILNERKEEEEVKQLLENERKQREEELDEKTYECDICCDDMIPIEQLYIFDCGHKYCQSCCYDHIHAQIFNGNVFMNCCSHGCTHIITYEEVYQIIKIREERNIEQDQELIKRYERFLVKKYLDSQTNSRSCPKCGTEVLGDPNRPEIHCQSEKCLKENYRFCFNCNCQWHEKQTCAEYQEWKRINDQSDKEFKTWAQKNTRPCPKCGSNIEKNRGCNHMTCPCGYQFCWLCMQEYTKDHFKGKCKQYS